MFADVDEAVSVEPVTLPDAEIDVALAAPSVGVVKVGEVARATTVPVPVVV